jgi:hypothetical protein
LTDSAPTWALGTRPGFASRRAELWGAQEDVLIEFSSVLPRCFGIFLIAWLVVAATALPGVAQQMRQQIADKIATTAANKFVAKINGESCSDFANTMSQMKQKTGSIVDCDMLPGGM